MLSSVAGSLEIPERAISAGIARALLRGASCACQRCGLNASHLEGTAGWRRGYAADCKSVKTGSIPVPASKIPKNSTDAPAAYVAARSICRRGTLLSAMGRGRAGSAQEACLSGASLLPARQFGGGQTPVECRGKGRGAAVHPMDGIELVERPCAKQRIAFNDARMRSSVPPIFAVLTRCSAWG